MSLRLLNGCQLLEISLLKQSRYTLVLHQEFAYIQTAVLGTQMQGVPHHIVDLEQHQWLELHNLYHLVIVTCLDGSEEDLCKLVLVIDHV